MNRILTIDGQMITLTEWQQAYGLQPNQLGKFISVEEKSPRTGGLLLYDKKWFMAEPAIRLFDHYRTLRGKPQSITSMHRHSEFSSALSAKSISPHPEGMALDCPQGSPQEVRDMVRLLKQAARELKYQVRIGYTQYLNAGMRFFHYDVCPMYFAPGKPFHSRQLPANANIAWRREVEW